MLAERISARGFRNLVEFELDLPPAGAVFVGPNAHGKTSLLECLYYPVLFRSFRGTSDADVTAWGGPGFGLEVVAGTSGGTRHTAVTYERAARRKQVWRDGEEITRISDGVGAWVAVVFLPTDLALLEGGAGERRRYLDRLLALADRDYLRALYRYRAIVAQRNAALRAGDLQVVRVFGGAMAEPGAYLVSRRLRWIAAYSAQYARESQALGEDGTAELSYAGRAELVDPEAWPAVLDEVAAREARRGTTLVGPQRDDLTIALDGRSIREFGSTGQQRTAATVLKLCELATLAEAHGGTPALLLDDVFAELDGERQERLTARLAEPGIGQVFLSAPRRDELPRAIDLEVFAVRDGAASPRGVPV